MAASVGDEEAQVRQLFKGVSTGTKSLTKQEEGSCLKLGEVTKDVLKSGVLRFAVEADQHPCSRSTMSDGTPITVTERINIELGKEQVFYRRGRACHEFQVGCSYYSCANSDVPARVLLRKPVPMVDGKTAMKEWAILQRDSVTLRQAGHLGPAVEHYSWGRAKFTALARIAKCFHAQERFPEQGGIPSRVLALTQFVVCTPCALHDVNKAMEWGMHADFANKEILRDCWVACESLRNSFDLVKKHMGLWISTHLEFTEPLGPLRRRDMQWLWTALGVEPRHVEELADELELRFEGDMLVVSRECERMPDLVSRLQNLLLAILEREQVHRESLADHWRELQGHCHWLAERLGRAYQLHP